MDPRSEVLLRQAELFQGSLLLVGLPADDLLGKLPDARGWCWHAGDQAALDARFKGRVDFGVEAPEAAFEAAVLFLPKARDLTDYLLNALASRLAGRELFLVGEKRGGIEAA
ncbi:ribosomal RNA small subunit methyltransferase C, partial [Pseudomonas amygdali pv. mori str. 301020]